MEASTATPELRPLSLGEILDAAFKIYKNHFKTLLLCVLPIVIPLAILSTLVTASLNSEAFDPSPEAANLGGAAIAGSLLGFVLLIVLSTLATAACTRAVASAYLGRAAGWRESLGFGLRKVLPLIAVAILTGLAVMVGLLALILPGLYVGVRLYLASPALVVEDESATGALGRSWKLVKDRWWSTFGTILVSGLIIFVLGLLVGGLLTIPAQLGDSSLVGAILNTVGQILSNAVTIPLQAAVLTILYFDLRVRKEGFDLALLSQGVGEGGGAQARAAAGPADAGAGAGADEVARPSGLGDAGRSSSPGGFSAPHTHGDPLAPSPEREQRDPS